MCCVLRVHGYVLAWIYEVQWHVTTIGSYGDCLINGRLQLRKIMQARSATADWIRCAVPGQNAIIIVVRSY